MTTGILFLVLALAVAVLITVDVVRTPDEAPVGPGDRHAHDGERALAADGIAGFSRKPAGWEQSVPAAAAEARIGADPAEVDSFERPDQAARAFDHPRRDVPVPSAGHAAAHGGSQTMWVNLSRRSQALVERQLRLIESLQHGEQDRQRLASLSRLNRIAMRVHRNSQNLLVLAGQEQPAGLNQPVSLAHLIEASVAEVENNERVSFEVQPDIAVRGPAVHDAVHLLVELIDNATSFSAADMPVQVKAQTLTTGGALVDITDRGIGMAAKEMAYANQQLDNPPPPDFDVPKWIGLLVVARLAARHGIRVRLNQADQGGLTAYVWLPDEILTRYAAPADPGYATPPPRGPTAVAPAFSPPPANAPAVGPDPAWSARVPHATVRAEPRGAARLSGAGRPEVTDGDLGVVVPQVESQATMRRLPIFDAIESRRSRGSHEAPGPTGLAAAPGPAAGGLPRRPAAGAQTVPATSPGAVGPPGAAGHDRLPRRQRGGQGWAAPAEETNPGGPDES